MFDLLKLKSPMGRSYNVDFGDVTKTKKALNDLNYYDIPDHGLTQYPDTPLFSAIEGFQSDKGLKVDGLMKPEGPTESTLNDELAKQAKSESAVTKSVKTKPAVLTSILGTPQTSTLEALARKQEAKKPDQKNMVGIQDSVGMSLQNKTADVISTQKALRWAGQLPETKTLDGRVNDTLLGTIGNFQKAYGLKQDHQMFPGGETEQTLNRVIREKLMALANLADDSTPPDDPPKDEEPKDPPKDGDPKDPPKDGDPKDPPKDGDPKDPPKDENDHPCTDIRDALESALDAHDALQDTILNAEEKVQELKQELEDTQATRPEEFVDEEDYQASQDDNSLIADIGMSALDKISRGTARRKHKRAIGEVIKRQIIAELEQQISDTEAEVVAFRKERENLQEASAEYERRLRSCELEHGPME